MNEKVDVLKIVILGYSQVGKSYYKASLGELTNNTGPEGFKIEDEKILSSSILLKYAKVLKLGNTDSKIEKEEEGKIPSTVGIPHSLMKLFKANTEIMKIDIIDIEGQALVKDSGEEKRETGKKIIKLIVERSNGIVIMLKTPINSKETLSCKEQLHNMLSIISKMLEKRSIPIALVLNQIDRLADLQELGNVLKEIKKESYEDIQKERSVITNKYIEKAINNSEIFQVIREFQIYVNNSAVDFSNGIFIASNIGFKSTHQENSNDKINEDSFGGPASFLWLIYENMKKKRDELKNSNKYIKEILNFFYIKTRCYEYYEYMAECLLKDIRYLYEIGKAYYNESDETFNNKIFNDKQFDKVDGLVKSQKMRFFSV